MSQLIKGRAIVANQWATADAAGAEGASHLILPLADYIRAVDAGEPADRRAPLLKAENHDVSPLAPYLAKAPLVAVNFASTGDGRGYTQARLLRERHGYKGELRAVGKIRVDQIFFLARCGFDAFELLDDENAAVAIAQLDRFSVSYTPGTGNLIHTRMRYGQG